MDPRIPSSPSRRRRLCGTRSLPDIRSALPDLEKAAVLGWLDEMVAGGDAEWDQLDSGDIRLRLDTGETYLLGRTGIVRLA
ncbi:MAG: hypothetical protein WDN24_04820 [Sphingomonas sp.]